jgi:hypothetical protein
MIASVILVSLAVARPVVVFPLDARGVAIDTADRATEQLKKTLGSIPKIEVIATPDVEKKLGVNLTEQARACEYDVFCLVEVGEILQSDQMIIGHVRRGPREPIDGDLELKLFVLDVSKAVVIDTLNWRVPGNKDHALEDAVDAATRKLFSPPSAQVTFELAPPNAEIIAYGDPFPKPKNGVLSFWPGTYHAVIKAEGYQAQELKIVIAPSGKTAIALQLQPDLLYVAKGRQKEVTPFDKASRREGSGVTALDVETDLATDTRPSSFANPWAWGLSGLGAAGVVVGFVVARGAQSDYNDYSKEERFLITTPSAATARMVRDDARASYRTGTIVAGTGAILALGGLAWMVIDSAISGKSPAASSSGGPRSFVEVKW